MTDRPLRIAHVGPVATSTPPPKSGSVEVMTSLLTEGLVARGHDVTLFATGDSKTTAKLQAIYPHGYWHDEAMWPWELYEMLNLAAAVEHAHDFDIIHYEAAYYPMSLAFTRISPTPIVQTLHHAPTAEEVKLWSRYPEAPFIAISEEQKRRLAGMNVTDVVLHGIDTASFSYRAEPDDYLLFLGRFTEGKGVLQAIEVAQRVGMRLILAAAEEEYYREHVAPHVDGVNVVYFGEADHDAKVKLFGGARALLYPVQAAEPFGLVLAEAMVCGTPVAALDKGAVREIVEDGVTGVVYGDLEQMVQGLGRVFELDRARVRDRAVARFGVDRMVDEYVAAYRHVLAEAADAAAAELPGIPELEATVVVVLAHPDDEAIACGGTIAMLARHGAHVVLVCASRGEGGPVTDPALLLLREDADLASVRSGELERSAALLGVEQVVQLDHEDGSLRWSEALEEELLHELRRHSADIVITFDADGLYWHPDHIGVHEKTTAAVARYAAEKPDFAPALYYVSMPQGAMRGLVDAAHALGGAPDGAGLWGIDPDAFGAHAPLPTLRMDVTAYAEVKLAAIRAHSTQTGPDSPFRRIDPQGARRWLATELFRRADVGRPAPQALTGPAAYRPEELMERLGVRMGG